ncbi:MAG: hypothetical protein IPJ65_35960 [Archangiaceae bacterium]|nr:hypothetical protein [Archangiaceae bacterium]
MSRFTPLLLVVACAGQPTLPPVDGGMLECTVTAPTSCTQAGLRYADVKPIFEAQCTTCHAGNPGGSWPLTDYQSIADWKDDVRGDLLNCSMPPYDGGVPMPTAQRQTLLEWIRCDMPQ